MSELQLTDDIKQNLLKYAQESLSYSLNITAKPEAPELDILKQACGVFVTLKLDNKLRGCIGCIQSNDPLSETIPKFVTSAALNDPRFPAVSAEEFPKLSFEMSLLSPPQQLDSYKKIQIGTHGIILKHPHGQALFLPKVATEFNWDLMTTLNHLAQKAGITHLNWLDESDYWVFTAEEFA